HIYMIDHFYFFFFFFQAEDGIRDLIVTGVQTCALPIFIVVTEATRTFLFADLRDYTGFVERNGDQAAATLVATYRRLVRQRVGEIGRASCRERCRCRGVACEVKEKRERKSGGNV